MSVEVRKISKRYGLSSHRALKDVDLTVPTGGLVALLGPSGSGKTTLLRIIAGLEQPDAGSGPILFHGEDVSGQALSKRRVGFVFQHYALFRHMTVQENVAFGLRVRPWRTRPKRQAIRERVSELLRLVQLERFGERFPHQISGGQRQRVALARALAVEPRVLLLDEPFGALDAKVRQELRRWLRRLHEEIHVTSLFVTHDQDEALDVADTIVVMNEGRVRQVGTPTEVFHQPATPFVMGFLGQVNRFRARLHDGQLSFGNGSLTVPDHAHVRDAEGTVFVRPHDLIVLPQPNGRPSLPATVTRVHAAGSIVRVELRGEDGKALLAELAQAEAKDLALQAGAHVHVAARHVRFFTGPRAQE